MSRKCGLMPLPWKAKNRGNVNQHAAGAQKKHGPQALGRSRGGLSTKIHTTVDALGNPVRSYLTGGQEADIKQAEALIEGLRFKRSSPTRLMTPMP